METADAAARATVAELVAHLVSSADAGALSGAELVAASDWFGLRSHPRPVGTVTFGGPAVPGLGRRRARVEIVGDAPVARGPEEE